MRYLLNTPLFLTFALLVLVSLVTKTLERFHGQKTRRIFVYLALTSLALASTSLAVFVWFSVSSPVFLDHGEPTTAIISWIYSQGGQIYHSLDAPERYSLLYGPIPYVTIGWIYKLVGADEFVAKVCTAVCLLIACVFIVLSVLRRYPQQILPCFIAMGCFSLTALLFSNMSFWVRADPFIILAASIGLFSCMLRAGPLAWMVCGVALGVAGGAKVTGVIYFLPYLAWFFTRDGYRAPIVIGVTGAIVGLLPFVSPEQVSLVNYMSLLRSAAKHGVGISGIANGLLMLTLITLPILVFLLWQLRREGNQSWLVKYRLVSLSSFVALILVTIVSAKIGSGRYHFLPFLPALAFLTPQAVMLVWDTRPSDRYTAYAFWVPVAAVLITLLIKAGVNLYMAMQFLSSQAYMAEVADDLDTVLAKYPQRNIYMGYGGGTTYPLTKTRTRLVFSGNPYLLDLFAMQDFEFSDIAIPQATIDRVLRDKTDVWLIPKDDKPFSMVNWYRRKDGILLFDANFRKSFSLNFIKIESSQFFDIYLRAGQFSASGYTDQ